jgi:hypothetical protein
MNWLKQLLNRGLDGLKKDIVREIDRAVAKIESGETQTLAVGYLQDKIAGLVAKARLPQPLGGILVAMLMSFDWVRLSDLPAERVVLELKRLRSRVEGARL